MRSLNFTTQNQQPLTIIPDIYAHVNGHPVLTYTYSIYKGHSDAGRISTKEDRLHLEKQHDPSYLGFITFEAPGKMFTYTPHGRFPLGENEVEELIEFLSEVRDNPASWRLS